MARRSFRVENHVEVAAHQRDGVAHLGARDRLNTAIFSVVNATLFRPLPFHDPEQLVVLHADLRALGAQSVGFSVPEFDDLRDRSGVFSARKLVRQIKGRGNLTGGEHPERLESGVVSPNYFSIGTRPQLGRLFDPGDTAPGFADAGRDQ